MSARRTVPMLAVVAALIAPAAAMAAGTEPAPPSAPAPAPASAALVLVKVGGTPPLALVHSSIVLRGSVSPYVAGQVVTVTVLRSGRPVLTSTVPIVQAGAAGSFQLRYSSAYAGPVVVRAQHVASPQQAAFSVSSRTVQFVNPNFGLGFRGASVRVLQAELAALHYAVPSSGVVDEATGHALIAYRKMTGLARIAYAGSAVFRLLERGAGKFHVRYPGDGRHVEADLEKQVLVEIEPGARVRAIYTMSSGKPSTPTVLGRFRVYRKEPGENSHGMVDSSYFISGYAIHGYAEVPVYAASHGCLRVPIPDAPSIYGWVQFGMPVDVYY